jgi:hypothetical protein
MQLLLHPIDIRSVPPVVVDVDRPPWQHGVYPRGQVPRDMKDDRSFVRTLHEEHAFAVVRGPNGGAEHTLELVSVNAHDGSSCSSPAYCCPASRTAAFMLSGSRPQDHPLVTVSGLSRIERFPT